MDHAVILAGGSGTRLWPVSRKGMPKQLLTLIGGRSLLQLAYERALTVVDPQQVVVCAGRAYADVVAQQLPTLPPDNLLAEPVGRDSLAAITWSSAVIAQRDADAVVAVLTADHLIVIGQGRLLADTTVAQLQAGSHSLEDAFFRLTSDAAQYRANTAKETV